MPPLVWSAVGAVSVALVLLVYAFTARPDRQRELVVANLHRGLGEPAPEEVPSSTAGGLLALARRVTTSATVQRLDTLLSRAGRPAAWPLGRVLVMKLVMPAVALALTLLYLLGDPRPMILALLTVVVVVAHFVPDLLLHSKGQERSATIQLELADTLDQMTIAVEAGLGFDSAMARAGQNGRGPLAEELLRTLQDVQLGRSRREAFEALAARTTTMDLRRFIRAVLQADAFGVSISDVLRTQAADMRAKRRSRAEEKAMQIPVKVIFPLMLCILPVLFIVLLGPAAMDIVKAFS